MPCKYFRAAFAAWNPAHPVYHRQEELMKSKEGGGKDSLLCLIRHKPDNVGLWIMSDQVSKHW